MERRREVSDVSSLVLVGADRIPAGVQHATRKSLGLSLEEIPLEKTVRLKSSACSRVY